MITIKRKLKGEDISAKGVFPAYSSDSENNGIVGYYNIPEFICDNNNPVYVIFGDHTRTMNIARNSFSVLDNVKVLQPYVDKDNVLLFIFSVWRKQIPNLGYKRHWSIAKDCVLELPIKNGKPDFNFMENFIAELQAERIAELEAYLSVSGLGNYQLTEAEEKALKQFESEEIVLGDFAYKKIFNKIVQGRRLKKNDQQQGNIPFVMSGVTNNGVANYISNPISLFPANSITLDIFGNAFYRNYSFGAGDDTGVYWNSENAYSKETMLFLTCAMAKSAEGKFSYGNKLRSSQSYDIKMKLPTKNGSPDFEYMETFVSAIQKLVIKDVVLYADQKIGAAEKVVNKA